MELSEEQKKDIADRANTFIEDFNKMYEELKEKYQIQIVYGVVTVPGPQGIHGLTVSSNVEDLKYKPKQDSFVENAGKN